MKLENMSLNEQLILENKLNKIIGYKSEKLSDAIDNLIEDTDIQKKDIINYLKMYRIIEDVPTNVSSGVATIAKPLMDKPITRRKQDEDFSSTDVIFDVDHDMYNKCIDGKKKFARWNKFIDEKSELGAGIRHAAKTKNVVLRNKDTTAMIRLTNYKK